MQNNLTEILLNKNLSDIDKSNLILDLAETKDMNLYENIILCLDAEEFSKYQNILVYALTFYPAEPLMEKAVHWLMNGNFEISHSAFDILNNIEEISGEQVDKSFILLNNFLIKDNIEDWRKNLVEDIVDMFE